MKQIVKNTAHRLVSAVMHGRRGGLSFAGLRIEKVARYLVFVANTHRLSFVNRPCDWTSQRKPKKSSSATVYDIGANNGDDVHYYLKKGLKVVAIEPNPLLVERLRSRFAEEIRDGMLSVLNVAVGPGTGRSKLYVPVDNDLKGSLFRPPADIPCSEDDIEVRKITDIIKEHGHPSFVKVDIEGGENEILHDMFSSGCFPDIVAAESHSINTLCELVVAGYSKFKIVESMLVHIRFGNHKITTVEGDLVDHEFPKWSSSGPFGDDLPGEWMNAAQAFDYLAQYGLGWKDIHASR